MIKVADGFKPLPNWEERIANAMRACKQDKHLTTQGVPSAVHALFIIGMVICTADSHHHHPSLNAVGSESGY
jgi:hypothetical protein